MNTTIFEQIGYTSSKVCFIYNLSTGLFSYLNEVVERVFEGDRQQFMQEPSFLLNTVHPEDRHLLSHQFVKLQQGKAGTVKIRLQFPQNAHKIIRLDAFPIINESGELSLVAGFAEDITDHKANISFLIEFARKKNASLEILSHDLRGPLSMVQSVIDLLESDHQAQNYSELTNYTRIIGKACESCINLIEDILSEEHLKSPTVAVKIERLDIVEKVREVVELYATYKGIAQQFIINAPLKAFVFADIVKMDQILNNLISNSVKFTQPSGIISLSIELEGETVLLKHADNGIGIPEELLPYLFEKYSKAARVGLHGEKTTGIGLSIIKDLVEVQGGEIWCESEEGKGTTFFVRLPAADEL